MFEPSKILSESPLVNEEPCIVSEEPCIVNEEPCLVSGGLARLLSESSLVGGEGC